MKKISGYAPEGTMYKCKWITCAYGLGLAGRGICSADGKWGIKNCGKYESDKDWQNRTEYQNKKRIYLDEYENQELLRSEYFRKTRDNYFWNRFMECK